MIQMDARADQRQSQTLSPRLQHAVRLLQMSSLDFGIVVRDVLGRNPFLEAAEGDDEDEGEGLRDGDIDTRAGEAAGEVYDGPRETDLAAPVEAEIDRSMASDSDLWLADGLTPARQGHDGDVSAFSVCPSWFLCCNSACALYRCA